MKKFILGFFLVGAVVLLGVSGCDDVNRAINSTTVSGSPRATVQGFINRCQAGDAKGCREYLVARKRGNGSDEGGFLLSIIMEDASITKVEEHVNSATVYVRIYNSVREVYQTAVFTLEVENNEWKISDMH